MTLMGFLSSLASLWQILFLARAILSWLPESSRQGALKGINDLLFAATEPLLRPIRRYMPPVGGTVDLSPVVAVLLLSLIMSLLARLL